MMTIIKKLLLVIIIMSFKASANPIVLFYISEIIPDSASFSLEILNNDYSTISSLDGWYITSSSDTAYFKDSLSTDKKFILITQDSLKTPLSLNPDKDIITLWSPQGQLDRIYYGNKNDSFVGTPKSGQSICLKEYWEMFQKYYYYLDSTPTLGAENDSSGAMGFLEGYITDMQGNPLGGLELIYDSSEKPDTVILHTVTTDSSGYFIMENISKKISLFLKNGSQYGDYLCTAQIYPNDTVSVRVKHDISAIEHNINNNKLLHFSLEPNYPNPFNNSTSFFYSIHSRKYIEISIYDLRGRLVEQLFSGFKNPGKYRMTWHTDNIPSGIYIIQLSSPEQTVTQKCVYLK